MKINHLIVGASNVADSVRFYCDFLGFSLSDDNPGAEGGAVLLHEQSELLVLPFSEDKLPNPFHFAFEADTEEEFSRLLKKAEEMGLKPRSLPPRDSTPGTGHLTRGDINYKLFYIFDPSGVNLEVMLALSS